MKLEAGKYYTDANGECRGPIQEDDEGQFHYEGSKYYFKYDGTSMLGDDPDLIHEW